MLLESALWVLVFAIAYVSLPTTLSSVRHTWAREMEKVGGRRQAYPTAGCMAGKMLMKDFYLPRASPEE